MNRAFSKLWLDYKPLDPSFTGRAAIRCSSRVNRQGAAVGELITALSAMLPNAELTFGADSAALIFETDIADFISEEEYIISGDERGGSIIGGSERGLLYGVFAYLREIRAQGGFVRISKRVCPAVPLRMIDHWDNADGTIERGYSGGQAAGFGGDKCCCYKQCECARRGSAAHHREALSQAEGAGGSAGKMGHSTLSVRGFLGADLSRENAQCGPIGR